MFGDGLCGTFHILCLNAGEQLAMFLQSIRLPAERGRELPAVAHWSFYIPTPFCRMSTSSGWNCPMSSSDDEYRQSLRDFVIRIAPELGWQTRATLRVA